MAASSKTQLLHDVHALLKKRYKPGPSPARLTVLEATVFAVCHEGTTREQANQALSRFKDGFFDWNEIRVSSLQEIQGALAGLPEPEERAAKIRRFLRQLFSKTYGFSLEALHKKPLKDAVKVLQEYEVFASDYVLASVIQLALGGHAIPVDAPMRRGLERLGLAEPGAEVQSIRSLLERAVPKNRGTEFVEVMEELTHDTCVEGVPDCPRCELRKICPTGQARKAEIDAAHRAEKAAARPARPAPTPAPAPPDGHPAPKSTAPRRKSPRPK